MSYGSATATCDRRWSSGSPHAHEDVKRLVRSAKDFMLAVDAVCKTSEGIFLAWPADGSWPFKGPALTYADRVNSYIADELHAIAKELGAEWPVAEYSQSDWPGLVAAFKAAEDWARDALLNDKMEAPVDAVPELPPEQPELSEPPTRPLSDAELAANAAQDNPLNLPLSGAAWNAIQEAAEARNRPVHLANIDPFTGEPI